MNLTTLAFGVPGGWEWILILVVALLIFGRRLPDVARSVGKSIVEFKKGIKDIQDDIEDQSRMDGPHQNRLDRGDESSRRTHTEHQAAKDTEPAGTPSATSDSQGPKESSGTTR